MINLPEILKIAAPIAEAILTNTITDNTSPKKQENMYNDIVPRAISTALTLIDNNGGNQNFQETRYPLTFISTNEHITPYEIAKNKKYKYNF